MSRFKILIFFFAVGLAASIVATTYWFYTRIMGRDSQVEVQIEQIKQNKAALPDPGIKRFELALEQLKSGQTEEGRTALYDLLRHFPNSNRTPEAKRIVGEMNMDTLFSLNDNSSKKDYVVQVGESLGRIAQKNQTTIDCLMRANGLMSNVLQPGDHLFVFPLDFELVVDISAKTVTLLRNERFFKEYPAVDIRLPFNLKTPANLTISGKTAWSGDQPIASDKPLYGISDKWLQAEKGGLNIRPHETLKIPATVQLITPGSREKPKPKPAPPKPKVKAKNNTAASKNAEVSTDDASEKDAALETGVFLAREDTEELFTIIRTGTVLKVVR